MRNLTLFFAFVAAITWGAMAQAADDASAKASASSMAKASAAASAKAPLKASAPMLKEAPPVATSKEVAKEPMGEVELSQRIAERLAALKARQAEQAKQQAHKVRKKAKTTAATAVMAVQHSEHWSYEGEHGPANWGKINSAWSKCALGNRQSPIDIRNGMKVELEQVGFDYHPSGFSVVDNGHTIQVNVGGGNFITILNRQYELLQFHFHRPSEERINGKGFEMVVHLVHKDAEGKFAVVAVLIERGKVQPLIQTIWNNLPLEKHDVVNPSISIDMTEILPIRRDYFTFMGSLTTPPCTEGVLWMVMKEPIQATPAQLAFFSRLYPMNARPVQSASGRVIKESN
jgi:carbonic anhydrase